VKEEQKEAFDDLKVKEVAFAFLSFRLLFVLVIVLMIAQFYSHNPPDWLKKKYLISFAHFSESVKNILFSLLLTKGVKTKMVTILCVILYGCEQVSVPKGIT
jgi:hypothetical protein